MRKQAINNKLQSGVPTYSTSGAIVNNCIKKGSLVILPVKKIKFVMLQARKYLSCALHAPVCHTTKRIYQKF